MWKAKHLQAKDGWRPGGRTGGGMMRVIVDLDRCEGHARCVEVAPDVFALNDEGQSVVLVEHPSEELRPQIERAVRLCPRQAITIVEESERVGG
jgi:ferredoxin